MKKNERQLADNLCSVVRQSHDWYVFSRKTSMYFLTTHVLNKGNEGKQKSKILKINK